MSLNLWFSFGCLRVVAPRNPPLLFFVPKTPLWELLLIERRGLPERNRAPQDGHTLLHRAISGGHAAVVEKLLAGGVDKEAKCNVRRGGAWGVMGTGNGSYFVQDRSSGPDDSRMLQGNFQEVPGTHHPTPTKQPVHSSSRGGRCFWLCMRFSCFRFVVCSNQRDTPQIGNKFTVALVWD